MKRAKFRPDRCALCGGECVPCVNNYGNSYMGCKVCVVLPTVPAPRCVHGTTPPSMCEHCSRAVAKP